MPPAAECVRPRWSGAGPPGTAALAGRLERTGRKDVVTPIVEGLGAYRISVALASAPLVSIIIPTAGHVVDIEGRPLDLLVNCIETIITRSTYKHIEFIVVDNGDLDHGRLSHVMAAPIRFVTYAEPVFNVAKKLNLGATVAAGPILLLLNDDTEPMSRTARADAGPSREAACRRRGRQAPVPRPHYPTCRRRLELRQPGPRRCGCRATTAATSSARAASAISSP